MKLKKTDKFRFKVNTPWGKYGKIVEKEIGGIRYSDYPSIFDRLYEFENGTLLSENDIVYEIEHCGESIKETTIKEFFSFSVHDSPEYRENLFPTKESAKVFIKERNKLTNDIFLNKEIDDDNYAYNSVILDFEIRKKVLSKYRTKNSLKEIEILQELIDLLRKKIETE